MKVAWTLLAFLGLGLTTLVGAAATWLFERPNPGVRLDSRAFEPALALAARHRPVPVPHTAVVEAIPPSPKPILGGSENILLVGVDRGPSRKGAGLADALLVAAFNRRGEVALIGIPRDLYVKIPDHRDDRINTLLNVARSRGENGLGLLARVIEDTLRLPIAHGVVIDLGVFERAVEILGGISVQVRCPIIDNFVDPREPSGRRMLNLEEGMQLMDGPTAAMFVRSRHGRSDWSRARRQQAVLVGMREKFLSVGGLARLPQLWGEFERSLITDMSRWELFRLVRRVAGTPRNRLHGLVLDHTLTEHWRTPDGRSVLLPKTDAIARALRARFKAPTPGTLPSHSRCPPADVAVRHRWHKRARPRTKPAIEAAATRPRAAPAGTAAASKPAPGAEPKTLERATTTSALPDAAGKPRSCPTCTLPISR